MQYPIPQFIEEEGKIVFFLTFRQFFLLVGGGVICFILFFTTPFFISVIGSIFVMALVSIIAFLKINGIPIVKVALNFLGFLAQTKNYIWKREEFSKNQEGVEKTKEIKYASQPQTLTPPIDKLQINPKEHFISTSPISKLENIKKIIETKK